MFLYLCSSASSLTPPAAKVEVAAPFPVRVQVYWCIVGPRVNVSKPCFRCKTLLTLQLCLAPSPPVVSHPLVKCPRLARALPPPSANCSAAVLGRTAGKAEAPCGTRAFCSHWKQCTGGFARGCIARMWTRAENCSYCLMLVLEGGEEGLQSTRCCQEQKNDTMMCKRDS